MKYHTLFLSKTRKDVSKFVVCCSLDWRFKGYYALIEHAGKLFPSGAYCFAGQQCFCEDFT